MRGTENTRKSKTSTPRKLNCLVQTTPERVREGFPKAAAPVVNRVSM